MDKSKKLTFVKPEDIDPVVIYSNYIVVPRGRSWPGHNIRDLELVFVLNGVFSAKDADRSEEELRGGDILLIRPGIPCDLIHREDGKPSLISCIHFELLSDRKWVDGGYRIYPEEPWVIKTQKDIFLIELFRRCAVEFGSFNKFREELMSAIFKQIWLILMRYHLEEKEKRERTANRIEAMVSYIRENSNKNISRVDLAREFCLTPQYVNYLFKKNFGMSPGEVIMREKVYKSLDILRKGRKNISEVAYMLGFNDPLYFSRVFRRVMGAPPSRFR